MKPVPRPFPPELMEPAKKKVEYVGYMLYGPSGHPNLDSFSHHAHTKTLYDGKLVKGYSVQPVKIKIEIFDGSKSSARSSKSAKG